MFGEFRQFFVFVCNVHVTTIMVPFGLRFTEHPVMVWFTTVAAYTIFKPCTCMADLGFYLPCVLILQPFLGEMKVALHY